MAEGTQNYRRRYYSTDESSWSVDDTVALVELIQARRLRVWTVDIEEFVRQRLRREVVERGISAILREPFRVQEDLIGPGTSRPEYVALVSDMVAKLAPRTSLVLVDPWLLTSTKRLTPAGLATDVLDAIAPAVASGARLTFCAAEGPADVRIALQHGLRERGHSGEVQFRTSQEFHDRFIVADGDRGLFLGASFNSVGSRYSLVDYLTPEDARSVAAALLTDSQPI